MPHLFRQRSDFMINNINNMTTLFSSLNTSNNNSNNGISSLFSSLSAGNSSFNSLNGINISDYASIKNGSYYKVMKKYYSEGGASSADSKSAVDAYLKKNQLITDSSSSLSTTINDLRDMSYTEENRDDLVKKIEEFAKDYNSMIDGAGDSDSKFILQKASWLTNITKEYSETLENIGIEVGSNNKLTVNTDALKEADLNDLKGVFGANVSNFSNKVLYKAEQIYSLSKTYGTSATAYTSSGAYNRTYTAENSFDTLL